MKIDDCTRTGRQAYTAQHTEDGIAACAAALPTPIRDGAYEIHASAVFTADAPRSAKQQQRALILKCNARDALAGALLLAGWRDEWTSWSGTNITLWFPPR